MSELFEAIKRGDEKSVASLLDGERKLLTASENGVSAILMALYHGHPELARLFTERGVSLSFAEACALGDLDRVGSLLKDDPSLLQSRTTDGYPAFALAIFFGQPDVARHLIEQGADVNAQAQNAQGVFPVHAAAAANDTRTMKMLLDRGADPNARQQLAFTALHGAASRGNIEMAKLLIVHGADPKARSADGKDAATVAEEHDQPEFARWIRTVT